MIVRSGAELDKLFDTVAISEILGDCEEESLALFKGMNLTAELPSEGCEHDREGTMLLGGEVEPSKNLFGFWLPHGLSTEEETRAAHIASCLSRFNAIEKAYYENYETGGIPESAPVVTGEPDS